MTPYAAQPLNRNGNSQNPKSTTKDETPSRRLRRFVSVPSTARPGFRLRTPASSRPQNGSKSWFPAGFRRYYRVFTSRLIREKTGFCRSSAELVELAGDDWERQGSGSRSCRYHPLLEKQPLVVSS